MIYGTLPANQLWMCEQRPFSLMYIISGGGLFMLLEDVLQEYLYDCQLRKLSERTIKSLRNNNTRLFSFLSNTCAITKLEQVKRVHIQSYITHLSEQGRKETYINGIIKSFRAFFKYCENEDYIQDNPMQKISFQKEVIPVIRTFNNTEIKKMIHYYNGKTFLQCRNNLIMVMLLDSGIRNSELCNIQMEDVHENAIKIYGKGKKIRYVPLTPAINKSLIRYRRVRNEYIQDKTTYHAQYLLLSQKGKRLTPETVERIVKDCGQACGIRNEIRCSPHTCRHYYAQTQLKNGCDLFVVSRLLGHSNINITKRYLNSMEVDDIMEVATQTTPLKNM